MPGDALRLRVSVDRRHAGGHPIDRLSDLPSFRGSGVETSDARAMRQGVVMRETEHVEALRAAFPNEEIEALVGNGNLFANPHFVFWADGRLLALAEEPVHSRHYDAIVARKDGSVTCAEVTFAEEHGHTLVFVGRASGGDRSGEIDFVTTGVSLVRHGRALRLEDVAERSYDPRHLVCPLSLRIGDDTLFYPSAQLQRGLLRAASARPVQLDLLARVDEHTVVPLGNHAWNKWRPRASEKDVQCLEDYLLRRGLLVADETLSDGDARRRVMEALAETVREALEDGGYEEVDDLRDLEPGEYRFVNSHIELFLRPNLYPHNIFVRWSDGRCGFVVFPGRSGREGTTIAAAQEFLLEELRVESALMLDQGADVRLRYRGLDLVAPFCDRPEIRSVIALTRNRGASSHACPVNVR